MGKSGKENRKRKIKTSRRLESVTASFLVYIVYLNSEYPKEFTMASIGVPALHKGHSCSGYDW